MAPFPSVQTPVVLVPAELVFQLAVVVSQFPEGVAPPAPAVTLLMSQNKLPAITVRGDSSAPNKIMARHNTPTSLAECFASAAKFFSGEVSPLAFDRCLHD